VAQGGTTFGYAVYLHEGNLKFTVREEGTPVSITASNTPPGAFKLKASLASDGTMSLAINDHPVAEGKAAGLISRQPAEDFCVGHDNRMPVGTYVAPARFTGTIKNLKIANE
jgi:arylsulfatase